MAEVEETSHWFWSAVSGALSMLLVKRFQENHQRYKNPDYIPEATVEEILKRVFSAQNCLEKMIQSREMDESLSAVQQLLLQKQLEHHLAFIRQHAPDIVDLDDLSSIIPVIDDLYHKSVHLTFPDEPSDHILEIYQSLKQLDYAFSTI